MVESAEDLGSPFSDRRGSRRFSGWQTRVLGVTPHLLVLIIYSCAMLALTINETAGMKNYFHSLAKSWIYLLYSFLFNQVATVLLLCIALGTFLRGHPSYYKVPKIMFALAIGTLVIVIGSFMVMKADFSLNAFENILHYSKDKSSKDAMDTMQNEFNCCGWYEFMDWKHNFKFVNEVLLSDLPRSCCKPDVLWNNNAASLRCGISYDERYEESYFLEMGNHTVITNWPEYVFRTEGCYKQFTRAWNKVYSKLAVLCMSWFCNQALAVWICLYGNKYLIIARKSSEDKSNISDNEDCDSEDESNVNFNNQNSELLSVVVDNPCFINDNEDCDSKDESNDNEDCAFVNKTDPENITSSLDSYPGNSYESLFPSESCKRCLPQNSDDYNNGYPSSCHRKFALIMPNLIPGSLDVSRNDNGYPTTCNQLLLPKMSYQKCFSGEVEKDRNPCLYEYMCTLDAARFKKAGFRENEEII